MQFILTVVCTFITFTFSKIIGTQYEYTGDTL